MRQSVYHRSAALALADDVGDPQPEWRSGQPVRHDRRAPRGVRHWRSRTISMDWYYPISVAHRASPAAGHGAERWHESWSTAPGHPLRQRPAGDRGGDLRVRQRHRTRSATARRPEPVHRRDAAPGGRRTARTGLAGVRRRQARAGGTGTTWDRCGSHPAADAPGDHGGSGISSAAPNPSVSRPTT